FSSVTTNYISQTLEAMAEPSTSATSLHIVMYPWFAVGHITSFIHLANKLADRGHRITILLPSKTLTKIESNNRHPNLISFVPISVPHFPGLPPGAETTADIPFNSRSFLMSAMDETKSVIQSHLRTLNPHFVFYDFSHWLPSLARDMGIKSVHYCTISPATVGYLISPERGVNATVEALMQPPLSFPASTSIRLRAFEAKMLAGASVRKEGSRSSFVERQLMCFEECDAIGFKTCAEMEGPYCRYVEEQFKKPVILAGPVVPKSPKSTLEPKISEILNTFTPKSVIFCSFGSECRLKHDQFQELVLGLELTGLPFLVAIKPPIGFDSIESALPEGFQDKNRGRGFVSGEWVQQQLILDHPSVGCFVTHCGSGSLSEAMVNDCQLVLLPYAGDQIINARVMSGDLRVGVEVEKGEEDGLFSKEDVCKVVKVVMDEGSGIGEIVRKNHRKWREFILSDGVEDRYVKEFVSKLHELLV
ncbi:Cyanidin 3-O-galactoside 2''-O-xylosyltransferase FGGT1, partial [Linum perenne]